jgi:inorganic pyrophosphatase
VEEAIEVLVEIPRGGRNKYEWDEAAGVLRLDRTLYSSVHYPADYGFIIHTHAEDGDHLDALVLVEEPTVPGCHVMVRPIGVLRMRDEKGEDNKIISVPLADPRFAAVQEFSDVAAHWQLEIDQFFRTYKALQSLTVEIYGWGDRVEAWRVIDAARAAYASLHLPPGDKIEAG